MAVTVNTPPQIPSDAAGNVTTSTSHVAGVATVTKITTLPKLTPTGTAGSVTEVNGRVTAYTPPT